MITLALSALILWQLYALLERWLLAMMLLLVIVLSSGCSYYIVPAKPKVHFCYPANSWRCDPRIEWSQM
jgi:hypothetical protein